MSVSPGDVLYGRLRSHIWNKVYQPDFTGLCSGEFIVLPESSVILAAFLKYRLNRRTCVTASPGAINTGDRPRVDFDQAQGISDLASSAATSRNVLPMPSTNCSPISTRGWRRWSGCGTKLKLYRASVLKAAVEGDAHRRMAAAASAHRARLRLLKRILAERRRRWEEDQLRKFKEKGQEPPKNWKAKYKEPVAPDTH